MLYAYVLVALTFFVRFSTSSPMEITNEELYVQKKHEDHVVEVQRCNPAASNDRSTNLKYITAIQSLTIWSEIKKRILTMKLQPQIGKISEKPPDKLTDKELLKLKQVCQEGLKCVAVDQLIALRMIVEPTNDGKVLVRKTITKIINVLTQYTTEYHQDTYKYAEIKDSDDLTKVKEMVTIIVEDNRELCQIDVDVVADEKNFKDDDTTNTGASNVSTIKALSNNKTPDNGIPYKTTVVNDGPSIAVNNNTNNTDGQPDSTSNTTYVSTVPDNVTYDDSKTIAPNTNVPSKTNDSNITDASISINKANNDDKFVDSNIIIEYTENSKEGDDNSKDNNIHADITSAGSSNKNVSRIGYAKDSIVNNGKMFTFNINNGIINKAVINMTNANNNGIISVGNVDDGATNQGIVKNRNNNGMISNNIKTQDYMSSVNKLYSTVLKEFDKM